MRPQYAEEFIKFFQCSLVTTFPAFECHKGTRVFVRNFDKLAKAGSLFFITPATRSLSITYPQNYDNNQVTKVKYIIH